MLKYLFFWKGKSLGFMQKERDFPAEDNSLSKNRDGNSQGWKDGALNTRITCRLETDNFTVIGNCNNQNSVK